MVGALYQQGGPGPPMKQGQGRVMIDRQGLNQSGVQLLNFPWSLQDLAKSPGELTELHGASYLALFIYLFD